MRERGGREVEGRSEGEGREEKGERNGEKRVGRIEERWGG